MEYSERIYDVRIFAHYLIECNLSVYLICFTWNSIQKEYYTLSKPDPTQIVGAAFCILENDPNSSIKPNPASYPNIFFRYRLFCISKYIEYNQIDRKRNPDSWILKNF
jgi:hypothetical protein